MKLQQDIASILFTQEEIAARIRELGRQITADYAGKAPLVVGILRGVFPFLADLVREIDLPLTVDFMSASSYGSGTVTSGKVNIRLDLSEDIAGRDVIILEDILDTGSTLSKITEELKSRGPASLKLCVLLDKPDRRRAAIEADYVGFRIPDAFVVGFGLDYDQHYRQLPFIGILKPEIYD